MLLYNKQQHKILFQTNKWEDGSWNLGGGGGGTVPLTKANVKPVDGVELYVAGSTGEADTVYHDTANGKTYRWDGSKYVVVGEKNAPMPLMQDADKDTKIELEKTTNENIIRLSTFGSERMTILKDGKIGIGVSLPTELLDIAGGSIRIRNNAGMNKVLVSDSNGVASWQSLDHEPPTSPILLNVVSVTQDSIRIGWTASTDNSHVNKYEITLNNEAITTVTGTSTSYTFRGLTPSSVYDFSITAVDPTGNISPSSPTLTISTLPVPDTTNPTAPNITGFTTITTTTAIVNFLPSTDNIGIARYEVYRNGSHLINLSSSSISFSMTGMQPGTSYSIIVRAVDTSENTKDSVAVTLTTSSPSASVRALAYSRPNATSQADLQSMYNSTSGINAPDTVPQEVMDYAVANISSGYAIYLGHNEWWYRNYPYNISWSRFGGLKSAFSATLTVVFTYK